MSDKVYSEEIKEFSFKNFRLIGILNRAKNLGKNRDSVVLVLVPYGLNPRFGPHRIHVDIARELSERGYNVFRFDSYGCGDSTGDITEMAGLHRDDVYWRLVFEGLFIDDISEVLTFINRELKSKKVVLAGICGGAVRSLLVGERKTSVNGIIAIGFPSTIDDTSLDGVEKMNPQIASFYLSTYINKIFSLQAWRRLLSFQSDYKRILKSFSIILKSKLSRVGTRDTKDEELLSDEKFGKGRIVNHHIIHAFKTCLNEGKSILTIFGGNDRYLGDFEEIIESRHLNSKEAGNDWDYTKHIVPDSNHEFSFLAWQNELIQKIGDWMDERFSE